MALPRPPIGNALEERGRSDQGRTTTAAAGPIAAKIIAAIETLASGSLAHHTGVTPSAARPAVSRWATV